MTFESNAPGIPVSSANTTLATVVSSAGSGVGNLSTSTRVATQTATMTGVTGTSTGTGSGFQAPESTGAAVRVEGLVGPAAGIVGVVFAMVL